MTNYPIKSYNDNLFRKNIVIPDLNYLTSGNDNEYRLAESMARKFCEGAFSNLEIFPYFYMTSGATEAIDCLLPMQEFNILPGEYRYSMIQSTFSTTTQPTMYFSYPFSGSGKFESIPDDKNIILDCAYIFSSNLNNIRMLPDNVESVIFSLSKSHNLSDLRIGWFFSKKKIAKYDILQCEYGYFNRLHIEAFKTIMEYRPNELYLRYKSEFSKKYIDNAMIENDVNLFAFSKNKRIPYYLIK